MADNKNYFICEWCGKKFYRSDYQIRQSKRQNNPIRFCSKECKNAYHGRNMVELTCSFCGKKFKTGKQNVHKKNNFCSSECCHKYHKRYNGRGTTTTLYCEWCNEPFEVPNSYIRKQTKRGQNIRFCSKHCYSMYREYASVKKYDLSDEQINKLYDVQASLTCAYCGEKIHKTLLQIWKAMNRKNIFGMFYCNIECRMNYLKQNNNVNTKCDYCNKEISIPKARYESLNHHYCSYDCWNKAREKNKLIYKNLSHYLRSTSKYENWRDSILERDNFQCTKCKSSENLQVHHIYSLYKICQDNNFDIDKILEDSNFTNINNGVTLCINCHHKVHPWTTIIRDKNGKFLSHASSTASEDEDRKNGKNLED